MEKERVITFPSFNDVNGSLSVYENLTSIPFVIERVFVVKAGLGDVRGEHAHRRCTQCLIAVGGRILVKCISRFGEFEYLLSDASTGLVIPPGIWATQHYLVKESALMVLCDRAYDEGDYLRDFACFKEEFKQC